MTIFQYQFNTKFFVLKLTTFYVIGIIIVLTLILYSLSILRNSQNLNWNKLPTKTWVSMFGGLLCIITIYYLGRITVAIYLVNVPIETY